MIRGLLSSSFLQVRSMGRFFYAVGRGRQTGVFPTWDDCKSQVNGFSGARYKKFATEAEAWNFVNGTGGGSSAPEPACSSSYTRQSYSTASSFNDTYSTSSNSKQSWSAAPSSKRSYSTSSASKQAYSTASCTKRSYSTSSSSKKSYTSDPHGLKRLYSTDSEDPPLPKRRRTPSAPASSRDSNGDLVVYTDGACTHNGFHGAKAGVGVYWGDNHPLNVSERLEGKQTNQRAELTAALRALEQVNNHHKQRKVTLYTDSKYTINCVTDWIHRWKKNGWKTAQKTDVLNKDDLVKLDKLNRELQIQWEYVPGHRNVHGNEEADKLAREGASQSLPGKRR